MKEILEKLDLLSFQSFNLDERLWEADLVWESVQPGKDKKEKKGEVGKLKAEIAELEEQVERLEKMNFIFSMLKWARGERLGPKRNLTGPSQSTPSLSTSPGGVSSGSSLFFVPQSTVSLSSGQPPMEVTVRAELKIVMEREKMVRDVLNFRFKRVTKISALLSFIHNFHLKMATHEIRECKQKAFLMDTVAPSVARYLKVFGLESHSVEELLGCVKRRLLGAEWKNKVLLEWERMQQSEGEKVWIFRGRVQMFLNTLGFDPSLNVSNGEQCRAEVLLKLLPLLWAEAEQSYNLTALSWEGLWERLKRVEESYGLEVWRAMAKFDKGKGGRGDGGTCPLPPEVELEGGRGQGGGRGRGGSRGQGTGNTSPAASSYSPDHCCQCGLPGHTQDKCTHMEATKHKKADSSMQQVCHFCFALGHVKSACRKYTKHREDQKKALPVGFVGVDRGARDLDWVVQGEVALDCWEAQEPLGEEDVSWEEAFESFRGGSVSTGDVLVGLVADLLGPEEDLLGYLKEREGIPTGGLYSPSDSLPNCSFVPK